MNRIINAIKILTVYILIAAVCLPLLSGCESLLQDKGIELLSVELRDGVYTLSIENNGKDLKSGDYTLTCDGQTLDAGDIKEGEIKSLTLDAADGARIVLKANDKEQEVEIPKLEDGCRYQKKNGVWGFGNTFDSDVYDTLEDMLIADEVIINEVMLSREGTKGFIELYNPTSREIDLGAYRISADMAATSKLSGVMLPKSYALIWLEELDVTVKDTVALLNTKRVISYVKFSDTVELVSCGGIGLKSCYYAIPTPGEENCAPITASDLDIKKGRIYINEVMLNNKTGIANLSGKRTAWAELYNPSENHYSLEGMFLSDDAENLFKWALPKVSLLGKDHSLVYFTKDTKDARVMAAGEISSQSVALYLTDIHNRTCQVIPLKNAMEDKSIDASGKQLDFATPYGENQTRLKKLELVINEVKSVHEAKSGLEDWVEIYNPTDEDIVLDGMYLTDNADASDKLALSGSIKAGQYRVFEGLTLSAEGERIYLTDGSCYFDIFALPKLLPQYTAGRLDDQSLIPENKDKTNENGIYLMEETKGKANVSKIYLGFTDAPVFSCDGGYYADGVELVITAGEGARIYYTTDGSTPSQRSKEYKEPIKIDKTTVIRAVALCDGYAPSFETVGTFRTGTDKHTLPVVCLSMTKSDLDYVCASKDRLDLRERGGYVEYYDVAGVQQVTFPAGFSIGGNGTRKYPQKTFNLHMRGAYGQSEVTYPFFANNQSIVNYQSLCLRNCGQDGYYTRIRDAFVSMATDGMHMNNAKSYFVIVYLNGKYHGIYEMKENQNEDYFVSHYGCERDSVQLVRNNVKVYNGNGTDEDIKELIKFATQTNGNDPEVFERYLQWVDEEAYTDYMIAVGFFVLTDIYNQKSVRSMDGIVKWQPILYDLDSGMPANGAGRKVLKNFFKDGGLFTPSGLKMETVLFNQLYENKEWRLRFAARYAALLNTSLRTDKLLELFEGMVSALEPEIERHCKRWSAPTSVSKWREDVENMRKTITNRRPYVIQEIKDLCGLSQQQMKELFPND